MPAHPPRPTRRHCLQRGLQLGAAAAAAALGGARAQAAAPGVSRDQILIGQVLSLEGGRNEYGVAVRQGVEAALATVNASGGVHGRQLKIPVADDQGKPAEAEAQARALAAQPVFLLFGTIEGGPSNAVMKVANELELPFFGPMAGSPTLRRPFQRQVFPVRAEHLEEFRTLLTHAHGLGMRRVGFVQSDSEVGRLHLENVRRLTERLGMTLVLAMPITGEVSDDTLGGYARQLREQKVELVFNHGSAGVYERLIRLARRQGVGTSFYGINSGSTQLVRHLGELATGMVFAQVVPSPWERKTALTRAYQTHFKAAFPDQAFSYGSLEGYLTARALAEALRRAGRDLSRPALLRSLSGAHLDIEGFRLAYGDTEHTGSTFVDTALVTADGRFRH